MGKEFNNLKIEVRPIRQNEKVVRAAVKELCDIFPSIRAAKRWIASTDC